jgi:molybdate transport system substrate-binding protein
MRSMRMPPSTLLLMWGSAFCVAGCPREQGRDGEHPVQVAAAADLAIAFAEMGRAFADIGGQQVVFSFGSTGHLAMQLKEGAPFDVYAAANVSYVDDVVAAGACDGATASRYARGRLALWSKKGGVTAPASLRALTDPVYTRIAIANPDHAPYGIAARAAMRSAGVWEALEPRLVFGENVRQALQFAESGNVEVAVVALPLVVNDRVNPWTLVDERLHEPLDQALVVCTRGKNRRGGAAFARFVTSTRGREILAAHGFLLPGEQMMGGGP